MLKRSSQLQLLKKTKSDYGGALRNKRSGRAGPRPISTQHSMHLVLRSSKATGEWSLLREKNKIKVKEIIDRFSRKWGVVVKRMENVGNHLHLHIQITSRHTYRKFIRAITGAIAMAVTGASRRNSLKAISRQNRPNKLDRFWDLRPFTRFVTGLKAITILREYFDLNALERNGCDRELAKLFVADRKNRVVIDETG